MKGGAGRREHQYILKILLLSTYSIEAQTEVSGLVSIPQLFLSKFVAAAYSG